MDKEFDRVLMLDTSCFSRNVGDKIIVQNIYKHMAPLLERSFVLESPTHIPIMNYRMFLSKRFVQWSAKDCNYKFVCGTNLLTAKRKIFPFSMATSWQVGIPSTLLLHGCILVGAGLNSCSTTPNYLSKVFYRKLLSDTMIHSVRDSQTQRFLSSCGIKSINTGCPTTWSLNDAHCEQIPCHKSKNVVFTITDYHRDFEKDQQLLDTLIKNYDKVFFWPQGMFDCEYFQHLQNTSNIVILNPNLQSYQSFLSTHEVDYVGTRLHSGILAMQYQKRSIIIAIDNRTKAIDEDIHLNMIERDQIEKLDSLINSNFATKLKIHFSEIRQWLQQFEINLE